MAGHSKWANTKHRKARIDQKRGKIFSKIAKEVMVAARDGGWKRCVWWWGGRRCSQEEAVRRRCSQEEVKQWVMRA